jgi:pilus assembly protein CpaF
VRILDLPGVQPVRHLLLDPDISEIMINGPRRLFVERRGVMEQLQPVFTTPQHVQVLVENLLSHTGRSVTVKSPFVDFRLPGGERVNVVIDPIALDGPVVTIRKASKALQTMKDLVARDTLTEKMAYFLYAAILAKLNILFCGGTATGKTTTLGLLSGYIPPGERIVVIEDTAELELRQPHVVRMECRPPNIEGAGGITLGDLLRNTLRMRPTRIIVGEVRGEEAFEMLNAMSSGHDGCLAVLHSSTPAHAISRLELMVLSRGLPLPVWAIQRQIGSAVHLIVQHALLNDGSRRVTHITEVGGVAGDSVVLHDLYKYVLEDYDKDGRAVGHFQCTGTRPLNFDKLRRAAGEAMDGLLDAGPA